VVVVSLLVPRESPSVFSSAVADTTVLSAVCCFRLSARTAQQVAAGGDAATRLLHRYYKHATADESVKKTFKCIGQARNFDDLGLPSWMRRFNAKPVIINKSGEVYTGEVRGVRYLEIDILVGKWGLMARRGLLSLLPRYKDLDCEIGFVLQGHEDSELPERILGGARLPFVDPETAFVPWAPPS